MNKLTKKKLAKLNFENDYNFKISTSLNLFDTLNEIRTNYEAGFITLKEFTIQNINLLNTVKKQLI